MIYHKKTNFWAKILVVGLVFSVAAPVLAASWNNPPTSVPPAECPDSNPGCNPPLNISLTGQIKTGTLNLGSLKIALGNLEAWGVDLSSTIASPFQNLLISSTAVGKEALNIVGTKVAGSTSRLVKIWDNLNVVGTTTTNNLVVNNRTELTSSTYICTGTGSARVCNTINSSTGSSADKWASSTVSSTRPAGIYYASGNVSILNSPSSYNPGYKFLVEPVAGSSLGITYLSNGESPAPVAIVTREGSGQSRYTPFILSGSDLRFFTGGGTEKARFDSVGNLGIGTNVPASKLDVIGDVCSTVGGVRKCLSSATASTGGSKWATTTAGDGIYYNLGKVGIGTNAPSTKLSVNTSNIDGIRVNVTSGYGGIALQSAGTDKLVFGYAGSSGNYGSQTVAGDVSIKANNTNLHFVTGSGNAATTLLLSSTGNVAIGAPNTISGSKLTVNGYSVFMDGIGLMNNSLVSGNAVVEFGSGITKEPNAGRIGYQFASNNALDIFGAGSITGSRLVKIWDNLNVPGNIYTTNLCTVGGSCSAVSNIINNIGSGVSKIIAGTGITVSPASGTGNVTVAVNPSTVQTRVTGTCASGSAIRVINSDGTVTCQSAGSQWTTSGSNIYYSPSGNVGKVGINIVSPAYSLHVNGDAYVGTDLKVQNGFTLVTGAGLGKILMSDANGKASWTGSTPTAYGQVLAWNGTAWEPQSKVQTTTCTATRSSADATPVLSSSGAYANKCNMTYTSKKDLSVTCGMVTQQVSGGAECGGGQLTKNIQENSTTWWRAACDGGINNWVKTVRVDCLYFP